MRPTIDKTTFGSITIDGQRVEHDVIIRLSGQVKKRKKRLSKAVYGTSHVLSLAEAKHVYGKGTTRLIIGTGQQGNVTLSEDAADYFKRKHCDVQLLPTPEAILAWNEADHGAVIGLFHVTC
ncbi:MAG: Mth938-like domain-containing protein [Ktedonobacterales bacterium]